MVAGGCFTASLGKPLPSYLSPLSGLGKFVGVEPTACAVGCVLAPASRLQVISSSIFLFSRAAPAAWPSLYTVSVIPRTVRGDEIEWVAGGMLALR
jgi:hypothetical protein